MDENLEPPISYSTADLHDITGRLLGEMMYYPPTATAMKTAWAPLPTRYLSGRDNEMVQRWLDNAGEEGQIRRVLRNAVAKNIESPREGMPKWERRKEQWAESGDYAGEWCNLPVFDNYVYRAIDKLLAQRLPPQKLLSVTLDWLRINASVRDTAPSWRAKKLETLIPGAAAKAAANAAAVAKDTGHEDMYKMFFTQYAKAVEKDPGFGAAGIEALVACGTTAQCLRYKADGDVFEVDHDHYQKRDHHLDALSYVFGSGNRKHSEKETPMKTKFNSSVFTASLMASLTTTATVQGGNAGLTAIKQLTLKLLPIKWGFWARVTGKHKKVAEHPLTTLAVTVGLNALVHATTEENSKLRVISQSLQTAAVLEAVNGVGEIKNVVHSLLEPSQTDAE